MLVWDCRSVCDGSAAAMVNYKRAVCEGLVVLALVGLVTAAPLPADCSDKQHHYDQRQNGSENYRLNIDGVVIAVAPADSLLAAASDIDFSDLIDLSDLNDLPSKPPAAKPPADLKPQELKPPADAIAAASESKPDPAKPESALSDVSLPSEEKEQKKEVKSRKQEKAQRLKMRLANMLIPLLRRNRHHNNNNN